MNNEQGFTHQEKLAWMALWAMKNKLTLVLEGECGFGRECVGVSAHDKYPDYEWDDSDYNRIDPNGDVWTPPNAYHKHPCVAVLGRGEEAEAQLYDWLKWFDNNGFVVEVTASGKKGLSPIEILLGKQWNVRMVRKE